MVLKVYISSVSSSKEIKGRQLRIFNVLDSKKIPYEKVDIATCEDDKHKMRKIAQNDTQVVPYITNDDEPCGDFDAFELAVDDELLPDFLKMKDCQQEEQ